MMSGTEKLRELLDERGIEYYPKHADETVWTASNNAHVWSCDDLIDGYLEIHMRPITPEQAVEATLGRMDKVYAVGGIIAQAECRDVCSSASEFTCSACGFNCDLTSWISLFDGDDGRHRHHHHGTPNYCPNCGRKVVGA